MDVRYFSAVAASRGFRWERRFVALVMSMCGSWSWGRGRPRRLRLRAPIQPCIDLPVALVQVQELGEQRVVGRSVRPVRLEGPLDRYAVGDLVERHEPKRRGG